jgi:hypothetical protein
MEFFLNNPEIPRLPPDQTRLLELRAEPYPDGQRLRVVLDLTPFKERPYLELKLTDAGGAEAASASIVEPMAWKLELTLHIRNPTSRGGKYTLLASLSYPDLGEVDRRQITLELPDPTE